MAAASHKRFCTFLQEALKTTIGRIKHQIIAAHPARDAELSFSGHGESFEAIKSAKQARAKPSSAISMPSTRRSMPACGALKPAPTRSACT